MIDPITSSMHHELDLQFVRPVLTLRQQQRGSGGAAGASRERRSGDGSPCPLGGAPGSCVRGVCWGRLRQPRAAGAGEPSRAPAARACRRRRAHVPVPAGPARLPLPLLLRVCQCARRRAGVHARLASRRGG